MPIIEFRTTCISRTRGTFSTGDQLECSPAEAAHFVDDCQAADYVAQDQVEEATEAIVVDPSAEPEVQTPAPAAAKPRRRRSDSTA